MLFWMSFIINALLSKNLHSALSVVVVSLCVKFMVKTLVNTCPGLTFCLMICSQVIMLIMNDNSSLEVSFLYDCLSLCLSASKITEKGQS